METTPNGMSDTIREIVDSLLCSQCGTCSAVCPTRAIEMRETPAGLLLASINDQKCAACGTCRAICPGAEVRLSLPDGVDPFQGCVVGAFAGHACDEEVRAKGQSGGVVSALLLFLLESDRVDAALVTAMPSDGSLRPKPFLARTKLEILAAQGSKYCPVAANAALSDLSADERVAAVGVSCQIHGIHRLAQLANPLARSIQYTIGLFCNRTLLYTCIDRMAQDAGLSMGEIAGLEYRSKARSGWPGEVCFHLDSGDERFYPPSPRIRHKDSFTPPRCRLCFDKMNICGDLSVGDPWGVSESTRGESVVIARNDKALALLDSARHQGYVKLRQIDAELIFKGQDVERRRRDFVAFSDAWREMKRPLPEYPGLDPRFLPPADSATRADCARKLLLNCRVAESKTKRASLTTARGRRRMAWAKSLAAKLFGELKRGLRAPR